MDSKDVRRVVVTSSAATLMEPKLYPYVYTEVKMISNAYPSRWPVVLLLLLFIIIRQIGI